MNLQRLRTMGISEITYRSRQEASKWLGRIGINGNRNGGPQAIFKKMIPDPAPPNRFFEGAADEQITALIKERMPSLLDEIIAVADRVSQGRFDLLGYHGLYFGDPIDWHLDPICGRRSPLVHWSRLNALDSSVVGDSKVIWELNRHQWLVFLGQAYRLTGEKRYAETFARYVREWMRANPPGRGINWASSLEVALRIISWSWALFLFRGSEELSPELFASMLEEISLQAEHVEKYLSYYFAPNTHLTGEALGLFYAGTLFPELRQARRWRDLGAQILMEQSERHILPDGVYFEQSTCYQRYTVEIYLHFMILAARSGLAIPSALGERVQKMLDFLLAVCFPDGSIPQIGDGDGGWLLPLVARAPDDFRGLFSTAAAWFGRSDYAWAAGELAPETIWLLGNSGLAVFAGLRPTVPTMAPSPLFADGGYAVMRSDWGAHAHRLIFDVGPLGCPISGAHGHADLLGIQCSVFGEPYLVDPGTYCYTAEPEWRDFFRGTAAHSTVTIDNAAQAIPAGPFKWEMRPQARLRRWVSTEAYDFADAEHNAYHRLPDPVTHRRRVVFVKPRYWIVIDDLAGSAEHRVELRFQFAPVEVAVEQEGWARARRAEGRGLWIKPFALAPLKADVVRGGMDPMQGWFSPNYGQLQQAPVLVYSTVGRLPLRIVTLLLPTEEASSAPPGVSLLVDDGFDPAGLIFAGRESVVFRGEEILID